MDNVSVAPIKLVAAADNIIPEPSQGFVCTPYVEELTDQALAYLEVGYAVHFAGPAGTGKTTLAFHVAAKLGQPVTLIHGDDEFKSSDLVGRDVGYHRAKLVDNFIHSVVKTEENVNILWMDNRLTQACKKGYTLIYDEFTRSRPEVNNVLLSILEEKILNLTRPGKGKEGFLEVHPSFRAIFTSNPEEYAGTHKTQNALLDRFITVHVGHYDWETEVQITMAKSGIERPDAEAIVNVVRELRELGVKHRPTIRACIAIARVLVHRGGHARKDDQVFQWVCRDVLNQEAAKVSFEGRLGTAPLVSEAINKVLEPGKGFKKYRSRNWADSGAQVIPKE